MISVVAIINIKEGSRDYVLEQLQILVTETRKEAGCIDYVLHQNVDKPNQVVFFENWESSEHLAIHGQANHINNYRTMVDGHIESSEIIKMKQI